MNEIKSLKGCMIKVFSDEQEAREYLKPYSSYYYDMSQKIRDMKKHLEEDIVKNSKDKQEVFDRIMEQLDEASDGYYEKITD